TPGYGSRQLHPGDTLVILGGRYVLSRYDADILIPPSGTATAWVTIRGEAGNRPVLAGRDNLYAAVILAGRSYVRLENLEITHDDQATGQAAWFRTAISITGEPSSHIVLKDLYVHHIDEGGLDIQDVDDLQVLDSRFEYCGFGAILGPEGEHGGVRNLLIRGCTLSYGGHYYQGGDGSNRPYGRPDGFGIEPSAGPIVIEDTLAAHNYGDGLDSKSANTAIRRCIVANNSCDGVKLWGGGSRVENTLIYGRGDGNPTVTPWAAVVIGTEQAGATFELVNVTVDDTLGNNYLMHVQYDSPGVPVVLTVRNCILRGVDAPIWVAGASTVVADHNLFYFPESPDEVFVHGGTTYTSATIGTLGTGSLYGDPKFVARAWGGDGDYHLLPDSPALDAGTATGAPSDDLDGNPRPSGSAPDLGAYERQQGAVSVRLAPGWNLASIPIVP
ncbi:MAG: right-handed parallel beta-helix repeat-containing protein, partial [Anaerolineae bacterium]